MCNVIELPRGRKTSLQSTKFYCSFKPMSKKVYKTKPLSVLEQKCCEVRQSRALKAQKQPNFLSRSPKSTF